MTTLQTWLLFFVLLLFGASVLFAAGAVMLALLVLGHSAARL